MEDTDMIVEAEHAVNSSSVKRFGLKNSIQTNFGDDYIFQIVPREDWTSMAVSLSSNTVKLYSPVTGQFVGESCKVHSNTINSISFSGDLLHSCSSDVTLRSLDTRSKQLILFWDWRSKRQAACLEESHMEDVTQVQFVPDQQNKLVSASVDGLICMFDTSGEINDDDHLKSVINVGTSVGKVGFFGDGNQKLWCLSHVETLSIWDLNDARLEANFEDARSLASNSWSLDQVNYFVDCYYSAVEDRLWVVGGTNAGTLGYFPIDYKGTRSILCPEAILHGGHTGIVRSVLPSSSCKMGPAQSEGVFGWTGGEDGRLCCWLSDGSCDVNRSWTSSTLVIKPPKSQRKARLQPY